MKVNVPGQIENRKTFATGSAIRDLPRLNKTYGKGRWRKCKGEALVVLDDSSVCRAELHWYEANGIGKKEIKIKRFLDESDGTEEL